MHNQLNGLHGCPWRPLNWLCIIYEQVFDEWEVSAECMLMMADSRYDTFDKISIYSVHYWPVSAVIARDRI